MIHPDTTIYASDDSPESVAEAREYIAQNQLTAEDVRLIRKADQVLIITKRRIWE